MSGQVHIRCSQCGTFNVNTDHCTACGALLSVVKQRELVREQRDKEIARIEKEKGPSKAEQYISKMRNHRFMVVRIISEVIYMGWVVAMAIGAFIAWLIAAIVA